MNIEMVYLEGNCFQKECSVNVYIWVFIKIKNNYLQFEGRSSSIDPGESHEERQGSSC